MGKGFLWLCLLWIVMWLWAVNCFMTCYEQLLRTSLSGPKIRPDLSWAQTEVGHRPKLRVFTARKTKWEWLLRGSQQFFMLLKGSLKFFIERASSNIQPHPPHSTPWRSPRARETSQYAYMHARMPWHACISVCILGVFLARGAPWGISPGEKSIVLGFLPRRNRLVTGWPTGSTKKGVKKGGRFHVLEMCVSLHFLIICLTNCIYWPMGVHCVVFHEFVCVFTLAMHLFLYLW